MINIFEIMKQINRLNDKSRDINSLINLLVEIAATIIAGSIRKVIDDIEWHVIGGKIIIFTSDKCKEMMNDKEITSEWMDLRDLIVDVFPELLTFVESSSLLFNKKYTNLVRRNLVDLRLEFL